MLTFRLLILSVACFSVSVGSGLAQGDDLGLPKAPPPGQIGSVPPLAVVTAYSGLPRRSAIALAEYGVRQAQQSFPAALFRGSAAIEDAVGIVDSKGPVALFVPGAFSAEDGPEHPFGWLFMRYGEPVGPAGTFPESKVAHLILPGPMKITVLPLRSGEIDGRPVVEGIGLDSTALFTLPMIPAQLADATTLGLGAPEPGGLRSVVITAHGFSAVIPTGLPAGDQILPRPEIGTLKVGDDAPDFELRRVKEPGSFRLSSLRGKHPVVLIFGSFT